MVTVLLGDESWAKLKVHLSNEVRLCMSIIECFGAILVWKFLVREICTQTLS